MPSAAAYAAFLSAGTCPRCQKRPLWHGTRLCVVCPEKQAAAYKRWAARNGHKVRAYKKRHNAKLRQRRDKCLSCPAHITRYRRCLRCRMKWSRYAAAYRKRKKRNISP